MSYYILLYKFIRIFYNSFKTSLEITNIYNKLYLLHYNLFYYYVLFILYFIHKYIIYNI